MPPSSTDKDNHHPPAGVEAAGGAVATAASLDFAAEDDGTTISGNSIDGGPLLPSAQEITAPPLAAAETTMATAVTTQSGNDYSPSVVSTLTTMTPEESMMGWPTTRGLPNISYELRKPLPLPSPPLAQADTSLPAAAAVAAAAAPNQDKNGNDDASVTSALTTPTTMPVGKPKDNERERDKTVVKTAARKKKSSKKGKTTGDKEEPPPKIEQNKRVYVKRSCLAHHVMKGQPGYAEHLEHQTCGDFRFWGTATRSPKKNFWFVTFDLLPKTNNKHEIQRSNIHVPEKGEGKHESLLVLERYWLTEDLRYSPPDGDEIAVTPSPQKRPRQS